MKFGVIGVEEQALKLFFCRYILKIVIKASFCLWLTNQK
jgi:hypothetical protein